MTKLDVRARALAFKMLKKYGKSSSLKKEVDGAYDPETGTITRVETAYPIKVFLGEPNSEDLAGGQVVKTDEMAIFAAQGLSVEPQNNDKVVVDGTDRNVKYVGRVWSGEQVALWRVGLAS